MAAIRRSPRPASARTLGIYSHRSAHIERTVYKGIPVTTPVRTIVDLSGKLAYAGLRRAVNEALNRQQIKPVDLVTSHHRGAENLRKILLTAAPTRNEYEDLVLELLHRAGIGPPEVNRRRDHIEPDFRWPEQRVILEADSKRYHGHLVARASDRHVRPSSRHAARPSSGRPGRKS